jgi:hypothetical protein
MITPSILALGLIAGCGVFLALLGLGALGGAALGSLSPGSVSLADEAGRIGAGQTGSAGQAAGPAGRGSLADRALAPLAQDLLRRAKADEREWVERSLDLLNYPDYLKAPADYYAGKALFAMAGFISGVILGSAIAAASGAFAAVLALPLILSLIGYNLPRLQLASMLKARREQMLFEAPYLLDRLNISVMAERSLAQGLIALVSVPEGGHLMREFRQVAEDYLKNARLVDAFGRMAGRNTDVPLVERIASRLTLSEETGADVVKAMQVIGNRAHEMVENLIQERGEQNNTLMIVPTIIALIGIFAAIAGPSLLSMRTFL